jgi:hypothetical protein
MKQCPQCGSIYSDDTLNFCLTDRSSLVPVGDVDDAQTVIRERSAAPRTEVFHEPSPTIADTSAFPVSAGVSPVFKYLAIGLGLVLLLLTIGGFAAWSLLRSRSEQTVMANGANATPAIGARPVTTDNKNAANDNSNSNSSANKNAERSPTPTPAVSPTPNNDEEDPEDAPPPPDPGEGRINFKKGTDSKVFRGMVSNQRSYVLRTMSGQQLSASVSSPNRCVTFEGGSRSVSFATPSGDVGLTVFNSCDKPSAFTLSVRVR